MQVGERRKAALACVLVLTATIAGAALLRDRRGRRGPAYLLNLARLLEGERALAAMPYYLSVRP